MTEKQTVEIGEAKGRPMLHWVGKRPLDYVTAFPAQVVERFDSTGERQTSEVLETSEVSGNLLFHGDNKDVLGWLLAHGYRGKVNLVYIDPPFDSGADYVRRVQLRGVSGVGKLEGEAHSLGEQIQYTDIWANDMYLQFMYERLLLLKELLVDGGSILLHCDNRKAHHLRCLLDEVFGGGFVNEIVWRSTTFTGSSKAIANRYPTNHNTIYWYHKGQDYTFNKVFEEYKEEYLARFKNPDDDPRGPWQSVSLKTYSDETFARLKAESRLISPRSPGAGWRFKFYLSETKGKVVETLWLGIETIPTAKERLGTRDNETSVSTIWLDINMANSMADERTGYPTEKPDDLLIRIIEAHSKPGDLVLDCFVGSGTTAAVAQKLGRSWIAADINKGAIYTTSKRLQTIIQEQIGAGATAQQLAFQTSEVSETSEVLPAALSFSVYRVNDYDLQVQHNEAVSLAVEHIGIQPTKTDVYFDGTLGKRLVKIVPFTHPLTLLDLQLLQDELKARPDEERDIVLVCLGKETAIDPWLEDYNKRHPVNRIEVIELRTDQKYGKFFVHQPAQAQVNIQRKTSEVSETSEVLVIEIEDFISPTIVERLEMDTPLFKAQIPDWRAMVDVVLIDTAYDGEIFDITLSDVPERKDDLVSGAYELPAPEGPTTVAVKIIDMLGEEVLVAQAV